MLKLALILISALSLSACSIIDVGEDGKFNGKAIDAGQRVGKQLKKDANTLAGHTKNSKSKKCDDNSENCGK